LKENNALSVCALVRFSEYFQRLFIKQKRNTKRCDLGIAIATAIAKIFTIQGDIFSIGVERAKYLHKNGYEDSV